MSVIDQPDEPQGKARGGKARMNQLTAEQRRENALRAAQAKAALKKLPKATHSGELVTNIVQVRCHVLDDGRRVISGRGFTEAIDMKGRGQGVARVADHKLIRAYGNQALVDALNNPIQFVGKSPQGENAVSDGFEAHVLQEVCEAILQGREKGLCTTESENRYALRAELLMRAFARVGIIALIDEATGYQADRDKRALAEILEKFVAKELQPWLKTFPDDYYKQLFRLYKLPYPPAKNPNWRPSFFGHVTNNVVYARLAPELLPELKKAASKQERASRLHQHLTQEVGHPKLREHMAAIVTLMKISRTKEQFFGYLDESLPQFGQTFALDLNDTRTGLDNDQR